MDINSKPAQFIHMAGVWLSILHVVTFTTAHGQINVAVGTEWSTYIGGDTNDVVTAVAVDEYGHVYIAGRTGGGLLLGNDTTGQSGLIHQGQYGGGASDAFLAKIAPQGSMLWCTYFGGPGADAGVQIVITDMTGLYLIGNTNSTTGIATDSCFQDQIGGGNDAFVAQFTEYGLLLGASYLGGPGEDAATGGALDVHAHAVVCGWSNLGGMFGYMTPISAFSAGVDGFLATFLGADSLVQCTYVGAPGQDTLVAVGSVDSTGLVLVGNTTSTTGIATAGAWMPNAAGDQDVFIMRVDSDLFITQGTYFGGAFLDQASGLSRWNDRFMVCGITLSDSLPMDTTALSPVLSGGTDGFLAEFNDALQLTWSTYVGDTADDGLMGITYDEEGTLYAAGTTRSNMLNGYGQEADGYFEGSSDGLLLSLDSLHGPIWSSFVGGVGEEEAHALCTMGYTALIFGGRTSSVAGMAQAGHQMSYGGGAEDGFTARWSQERSTPCDGICTGTSTSTGYGSGSCNGVSSPLPQVDLCLGQSIELMAYGGALGLGAEWMWYADGCGDPVHFLTSGDTITIAPTSSFLLSVRAESASNTSSCQYLQVNVHPYPQPTVFVPDTVCAGSPLILVGTGADHFTWGLPDTTIADVDSATYVPVQAGVLNVEVVATNGPSCSVDLQEQVVVLPAPSASWTLTDVTCHNGADGAITLDSTAALGLQVTWALPPYQGTVLIGLVDGTYVVTLTDTLGCTRTDSLLLAMPPPLIDSVGTIPAVCGAATGSAVVHSSSMATGLSFDWGDGPGTASSISGLVPGGYTVIASDSAGCSEQQSFNIPSEGIITAWITADTLLAMDDTTVLACGVSPFDSLATYLWSPSTGLEDPYAASTNCITSDTITYVVLVTSTQGCTASDSVVVVPVKPIPTITPEPCGEAFLPDLFSPNGDGLNDRICLLGGCYTELSLVVYDRWGARLFSASSEVECWDGTYRGQPVPVGTYMVSVVAGRTTGEHIERSSIVNLQR